MNIFKIGTLALLLATSLQSVGYFVGDKLWHGTIKFPANTKHIPSVRIFYGGIKKTSIIEQASKKVSFDIAESQIRNTFFLVISKGIGFITEKNTPQYLKVANECPYKMFLMEFQPNSDAIKTPVCKADTTQLGSWHITKKTLADDRRIPDNAIVVCYDSDMVKSVEGGNGLELPKIILDEEIMTQLTDTELQDASTQFLLTALNCDSIHTQQNTLVKPDFAKKTVLTMICA